MNGSLKDEIKMNKDFDSPESEALLNIAYTNEKLQRSGIILLKKHKLTPMLYNALRILRGAGGHGLKCLDILDRMIWGIPDITRLVDNLEKSGLVKRSRCPKDRRVVYVVITEKGLKLLDALDKPVREHNKSLLRHMSKSELQQISVLMAKARSLQI